MWFHGASAGEIAAGVQLAGLLRRSEYEFTAAYTAANRAGVAFASAADEARKLVALAPWDVPRWVGRAFDRWQPNALFLLETELWPQMVLEASLRAIPVFAVSARIYPKDVARYRAIRPFFAPTLRRLTAVLAQDDVQRERFIELGAPRERCHVAGNLKHLAAARDPGTNPSFRSELDLEPDDRVLVFGSMHRDEIRFIFAALDRLEDPDVRIIIAPRHRSAIGRILRETKRREWSVRLRSAASKQGRWRVLVLDTMGELSRAYAIACIAIAGGSFGSHGGHNLFEAIRAGAPVIFGPHCSHFEQEAAALAAATPEARVATPYHLARLTREWLGDESRRRCALAAQQRILPDATAIAGRYISVLSPWFKRMAA
jgi:3-deoxy-D-manno-octulosonic-acid transferase